MECEPVTTGPRRIACACDQIGDGLRSLCGATVEALRADDLSRLERHVVAEIRARGCVGELCADTRYRDIGEVREAAATAGGFHELIGLEGSSLRLAIRHCPGCRNNQILSVCVSGEATETCLGGEGRAWRWIERRGRPIDVDPDGDDVSLGRDRCPERAETYDGRDDRDGCPERGEARIRIDRGEDVVVLLRPVEFEGDGAILLPEGIATLEQVAAYLRARPGRSLRIHLHVEVDPHPYAALRLADARANAIRDLLVERGVEPDRVQPVPTTDTATGPPPTGPIAQTLTLRMD